MLHCYTLPTPVKPGSQSVEVVSHGHFHIDCYAVTMLQCLNKSFRVVIFVSAVTLLRCYAVTLLGSYDVTHCLFILTLSPPCVGTHGYSAIRPWQFQNKKTCGQHTAANLV